MDSGRWTSGAVAFRMNGPLPLAATTPEAFADALGTPAQHLRLALFGVIAHVIEARGDGDASAAVHAHPFLADYLEDIHARINVGESFASHWWRAVGEWEREAVRDGVHLPLVALRTAGVSALELELLLTIGLVDEDPRFGDVFEAVQKHERRPTFGLLMAWWREAAEHDDDDDDRADAVRRGLQRLIDQGLIRVLNAEAPRATWALSTVLPVWDGLRGEPPTLGWLRPTPISALPLLDDYVASEEVRIACSALPGLLASRPAPMLLLRGPAHNGRKTLAGGVARALGKSILVLKEAAFEDEARWRLLGVLAAMTNAVPIVEMELAPGESRVLPPLPLTDAPLIVVTGRHGAWNSADGRPVFVVDLPMPDPDQRLRHWQSCWAGETGDRVQDCAATLRLSSGSIRTVTAAAGGFARLAGRDTLVRDDLRRACRTLQAARLETMATRLETRGTLSDLVVDDGTREELDALVARCRWRESLAADSVSIAGCGVGVRALFGGPSGTGKTLAARLLAAELDKDIYRLDLAAAVNKYLGETEKSLHKILTAAEELDVVLLLDEGDALMASRTDVMSSNDRYANLETNFLLQRIESFEGILVVTTNQADRIDRAFARRMDVVVNFRSPDAWRRLEILNLHLCNDGLDRVWLEDVASRCALSGGQWRNVVSHARLLALRDDRPLDETHLGAALAREYRKTGANCPLRPMQAR
jgi:hypothetical protein